MSVPVRRLLAVATALLVLGGVSVPVPASADPVSPAAAAQPCAAENLSVREGQAADDQSTTPGTVFALRNLGTTACRVSGGVGIRLLDASGNVIPLRFAPRTKMAMLLTLAPDAPAYFTVTFGPHEPGRCSVAARIEVAIPAQLPVVSGPTTIGACSDAVVTVSNLRLGPPVAVVPPSRFIP